MTRTAVRPAQRHAAQESRSVDAFAATWTLVRFMLRRDRVKLPAWVAGLGSYVLYTSLAIPAAYVTEQDLHGAVQVFQNPVSRLFIGPGYGFDAPTYERFVANGYGLYLFLLAALMSIFLVVRHTRAEEQAGRSELIRANVVGRHAPLTAALIVALITNVIAGGVIAALMVAAGFQVPGSVLFGASTIAVGLAFAGLAACTAQVSEYSRAASGLAGAGLGAAFVLRAGGDLTRIGGGPLSWFSPLAWSQQTAPYVLDRWWPLALSVGFAATTAAAGYALSVRRDVGAGLMAVRRGPQRAASWLGTPLGLSMRLQRGTTLWWMFALAASGAMFGAFADAMITAVDDMPEVFRELLGAGENILPGYVSYMATFMALLVSAYAILAVQSLRSEETSGRGEPVLATAVGRWTWLGSGLATAAIGGVGLLVAAGVATGLGAAAVTGRWGLVWDSAIAHLGHAPAVWLVLAVAALLFGVAPRAMGLAWVLVGYGLVTSTFGPLLNLPDWAYRLSPFEHTARMPVEAFSATPVVVLTVLAGAAALAGLAAFRARDIHGT